MTTKTEIIETIAAVADANLTDLGFDESQRKAVAIALGTPGQKIDIAGSKKFSGSAMSPEPTVFSTFTEGLALWLDESGATLAGYEIQVMKAKINELIISHNQLLEDHNSATVPSIALSVSELI